MKVNNMPVVYGDTNSVATIIIGFSYKTVHHEDIESIYNCEALPQTVFAEDGLIIFGGEFNIDTGTTIDEDLTMGEETDE